MIATDQIGTILEHAYIPEQMTSYVTAVSAAEPFLFGEFLVYRKQEHVVFRGYPLHEVFQEKQMKKALGEAVKDLRSGRVAVTSQNHGYAVDPDTLPAGVIVTHLNLNDGTCEGFLDPSARLLAVQYHPESLPGPHDSFPLFAEFRALVGGLPDGSRATAEGVP